MSQRDNQGTADRDDESQERQARPNRRKAPAKQKRDTERSNAFRERAGAKYQEVIDKDIQDTIWFGFENERHLFEQFESSTIHKTTDLSVATRGFGLIIQSAFLRVKAALPTVDLGCTVHQAYRISLLQVERQLSLAQHNQAYGNTPTERIKMNLPAWAEEGAGACRANFRPLVGMVNAIGNFEYNGSRYQAVSCPSTPDYEPLGIYFSNLQSVVAAMSSVITPRHRRLYFHGRCPLPGAKWGGTADRKDKDGNVIPGTFPLLANAFDFWPTGYGKQQLAMDIMAYQGMFSILERKKIKYFSGGTRITFGGPGDKRLLVASDVGSDPLALTAANALPQGDTSYYWVNESLPSLEFLHGMVGLLGEQPSVDSHSTRHHRCRRYVNDKSWISVLINLLA